MYPEENWKHGTETRTETYYVIFARDDNQGRHLCSRTFPSYEMAKRYADGVHPSRNPKILKEVKE